MDCWTSETEGKRIHDPLFYHRASAGAPTMKPPLISTGEKINRCVWVPGPVIVGAGPSGLSVAACLKEKGIPCLILERSNCIASLWQLRTYDQLRLHLPKQFCELPLMPFPSCFPTYPTKQQFIVYLESYVKQFDIRPVFGRSVESAEFDEGVGFWRIRAVKDGGEKTEFLSRWLIVATGENADAVVPEIEGVDEFRGPVMHTSMYRSGEGYRGKRVLVVGCGNSGMELCLDLCDHNAQPSLVVREASIKIKTFFSPFSDAFRRRSLRQPRWVSNRRLIEHHLVDLHSCSDIHFTKQLHSQLLKFNLHIDHFIAPKLIHSYSLSDNVPLAINAFRQVPFPNTHLYNTLIRSFANNVNNKNNSFSSKALGVFDEMRRNGVLPDNFTYPFLLKACSACPTIRFVEMVHSHVLKFGFMDDLFVPNSLIDAYAKVGNGVWFAKKVFDEMPERDVVSWNSMVAGWVRAGEVTDARKLFDEMLERDLVSWNTMIDGHAKAGEMNEAFDLFNAMPQRNVVSWSTVIAGYCKQGDMELARVFFDKMPVKNLVSWTIMVAGYAEKGLAKEASRLLDLMEDEALKLDPAAIVSVLAGCAETGLLGLGKRIHAYVETTNLRFIPQVCNSLVDMYAKCGNLGKALSVFEEMRERDVVTWNCIVQGLAVHGHGKEALDMFSRMKNEGFRPDAVTFIGVLCACGHVGLIDDARRYFTSMQKDYGLVPQIEHYGCMVDVLGRGGLLNEAFDIIRTMPFEPNAIILGSILSACRVHKNVELAEKAVEKLIKLEPSEAGNYAILSNIYAEAGRWEGMAKARLQMKGIGSQKAAGSSWIELNGVVHEFTVADRKHSQSDRIVKMLSKLSDHLKQAGYIPKAYI